MIHFSGTTPSLSGKQTLSFDVKSDGRGRVIKIAVANEGAKLGYHAISLDELYRCIDDALQRRRKENPGEEPYFVSKDLKAACRNKDGELDKSLPGFAAAVLDAIGCVVCINPETAQAEDHKFHFRRGLDTGRREAGAGGGS